MSTRGVTILTGAAALVALGLYAASRSGGSPEAPPASLRTDAPGAPAGGGAEPRALEPFASPGTADFPTLDPRTPAEVREVVAYCRDAQAPQVATLRAAALGSTSPLVTGNALRALGRLGVVRPSDAELVALLEDPRPRVRQETVVALGLSRDPASVELLTPLLAGEPALRPLVLQALGAIGTDAARRALEAYAPSASADEEPFLRAALEAAGA